MQEPCKTCNFDDSFITDYDAEGKEFIFCGNCGTIKKYTGGVDNSGVTRSGDNS